MMPQSSVTEPIDLSNVQLVIVPECLSADLVSMQQECTITVLSFVIDSRDIDCHQELISLFDINTCAVYITYKIINTVFLSFMVMYCFLVHLYYYKIINTVFLSFMVMYCFLVHRLAICQAQQQQRFLLILIYSGRSVLWPLLRGVFSENR